MNPKLAESITESRVVRPARDDAHTLCLFCHYDPDAMVAEYVVHYVKSLHESGCDVVFISNVPTISETELAKITPYVLRVILRHNKGYDMAAYFLGYAETAELHARYTHLLFANDSVYGPFYPLTETFKALDAQSFDLAGISDSIEGLYHVQSYFWRFKNSELIRTLLNRYARNFIFFEKKTDIVKHYEIGVCRTLIKQGLTLGALCPAHKVISFERWETTDPHLAELKNAIRETAREKQTATKRFRSFFCKKTRRYFRPNYIELSAYCCAAYGSWYSMIRYFSSPFLKIAPLKNLKSFYLYHQFLYVPLLAKLYPDYPIDRIENHLKRVRR